MFPLENQQTQFHSVNTLYECVPLIIAAFSHHFLHIRTQPSINIETQFERGYTEYQILTIMQ